MKQSELEGYTATLRIKLCQSVLMLMTETFQLIYSYASQPQLPARITFGMP